MKTNKMLINKFLSGMIGAALLCCFTPQHLQAQEKDNKTEAKKDASSKEGFEAKHLYIDLGVGFSRYSWLNSYLYTNYSRTPVFRVNLEFGFNKFISGGFFGGYTQYGWTNKSTQYELKERYRYSSVGFRASFHIWAFLNNQLDLDLGAKGLDLYVSAMAGARIKTHYVKNIHSVDNSSSVYPSGGFNVGAKYYVSNNFSVYVETGYNPLTWATLGIGFKL